MTDVPGDVEEPGAPARSQAISRRRPHRLPLAAAGLSIAWSCVSIAVVEVLLPQGRSLWNVLIRWDAYWYQAIALHGYRWNSHARTGQSVVFFPLFPLFERATHDLLGVPIHNIAVVSNVAFQAAAAAVLVLIARCTGSSERQAFVFVTVFLASPASVLDITGYSTALFCLLCFCALLLAHRRRPWFSALACGLASATNPLGIAVAGGLLVWWLIDRTSTERTLAGTSTVRTGAAAFSLLVARAALSVSGLLAYMAYLFVRFGDPLVFYKATSRWAPPLPLPSTLWRLATLQALRSSIVALPLQPNAQSVSFLVDAIASAAVLALAVLLVAKDSWRTPAACVLAVSFLLVQLQAARVGRELSAARLLLPVACAAGAVPAFGRVLRKRRTYALVMLVLLAGTAVFLQHLASNAWVD